MTNFLSPTDPEATEVYLEVLASTGRPQHAADRSGQKYSSMLWRRKVDALFAEACSEALRRYAEKLEEELHRRAVLGVETAVRDRDGQVIGTERRFSDRLLELALKKHDAGYREKIQVDQHVSGGVLVVGAQAKDAAAWQRGLEAQERAEIGNGQLAIPDAPLSLGEGQGSVIEPEIKDRSVTEPPADEPEDQR